MKKILIFLLLLFSFWSIVNAYDNSTPFYERTPSSETTDVTGMDTMTEAVNNIIPWVDNSPESTESTESFAPYTSQEVKDEAEADAYNEACADSKGCLDKTSFMIDVSSLSPWLEVWWSTTSQRVNWLLWTIIQKMMIALASISVLLMTVWGGYIILHNWQDELLSKWKAIFMSWIYAIVIALSSYYLISIVRYILYSTSN